MESFAATFLTSTDWLPLGFAGWPPVAQGAMLFALTFISEDLTALAAVWLCITGTMSWMVGFWSCFLGIWLGDSWLYWVARGVGRPLLERPLARRLANPAAVARAERWFVERGTIIVLATRFLPGSRMPLYLAAGFLGVPFGRFLWLTALTSVFWSVLLFGLAKLLGLAWLEWLQTWKYGGWAVLAVVGLGFAAYHAGLRWWARRSRDR
jgi:membrane protein DedA with SNARE-associated domain